MEEFNYLFTFTPCTLKRCIISCPVVHGCKYVSIKKVWRINTLALRLKFSIIETFV